MLVVSRARWLSGRPLDAIAYAEQIQDYAEQMRLGLVRTLLDSHEEAVSLIAEVGRDAQLDPVLGFYAERLQAAARDQQPPRRRARWPSGASNASPSRR